MIVAFGVGLVLALDVEAADVDDARELADAVEEDRQVVIGAVELERDRPLGVQLLGDDRRRLEALDRQVRLRRHRLHPAQQVGRVLLFGQHRPQVVEPSFELVDLRAELRQLLRRRLALGDVAAQRLELRLRASPSRRAPASRSSSRKRPDAARRRAPRTRRPGAYHGSFVRLSSIVTTQPYRGISCRALLARRLPPACATLARRRRGFAGSLKHALDAELDQLAGRRRRRLGRGC